MFEAYKIDKQIIELSEDLRSFQLRADEMAILLQRAKNNASETLLIAQRKKKDYTEEEVNETIEKYKEGEHSIDELNDLIVTFTAKADACPSVSQTTIDDHATRKEEVSLLTQQIAIIEEDLTEMRANMTTIKGVWYPRLLDIISTMNISFSRAFASKINYDFNNF